MLEQAILNGLIGLLCGIIGSFVGFTLWPWLRRHEIQDKMTVVSEQWTLTQTFWARVVNKSSFSMGKAVAYISINHLVEDMLSPPSGQTAYNLPESKVVLREGQLCWAVREITHNPLRVDIYAGEEQPIALGCWDNESIKILSESAHNPARLYLKRKSYKGILKVVCLDCPAKEFHFIIDPDSKNPLVFTR